MVLRNAKDHTHLTSDVFDPATDQTIDQTLANLDFPPDVINEFVTNIAVNETFITELTTNETFITELINETFITELTENVTYEQNFLTEITELTEITQNTTYITNLITQIVAQINGKKGAASELASLAADSQLTHSQIPSELLTNAAEFLIDGGGQVISTGVKGFIQVPYAHTFTAWRLLGNPSGSIVVDVWRGSYSDHVAGTIVAGDSICASNKPTLSTVRGNEDTTITDWIETGSAGDIYWFNVDSATSVTLATLILEHTRNIA